MPKVSEEYKEARRQEILDAAIRCFSRNGFHKTTMQDIYDESGLSPGAVYRYFKSKDDMIDLMCAGTAERDAEAFTAALDNGDTVASLHELATRFFGPLQHPETQNLASMWVHVWAEEARKISLGEASPADKATGLVPLTEFARRAQARGDINPALDPEAIASVMGALFNGLIQQLALGHQVDVSSCVAAAEAMFLGDFWIGKPTAVSAVNGAGSSTHHRAG